MPDRWLSDVLLSHCTNFDGVDDSPIIMSEITAITSSVSHFSSSTPASLNDSPQPAKYNTGADSVAILLASTTELGTSLLSVESSGPDSGGASTDSNGGSLDTFA